jgi:hypothetical protein
MVGLVLVVYDFKGRGKKREREKDLCLDRSVRAKRAAQEPRVSYAHVKLLV